MAVNVSVSFPETFLKWIDRERGEIKRSTYVVKLLRQTHKKVSVSEDTTDIRNWYSRRNNIKKANLKEPLQSASKVGPEEQSAKAETKPPGSGSPVKPSNSQQQVVLSAYDIDLIRQIAVGIPLDDILWGEISGLFKRIERALACLGPERELLTNYS